MLGDKTAICRERTYKDDDMYCSICGSPTIFWKGYIEEMKKW